MTSRSDDINGRNPTMESIARRPACLRYEDDCVGLASMRRTTLRLPPDRVTDLVRVTERGVVLDDLYITDRAEANPWVQVRRGLTRIAKSYWLRLRDRSWDWEGEAMFG